MPRSSNGGDLWGWTCGRSGRSAGGFTGRLPKKNTNQTVIGPSAIQFTIDFSQIEREKQLDVHAML
jgi:hypothetical protein